MSDPRADIETLMRKHAVEGSWRIDCFEVGTSRTQLAIAEWKRADEPMTERVSTQGAKTRVRAFEELLASVVGRLRR